METLNYVEQLYTQCLAQGAYFISSAREAAVIDPLREFEPYLKLAQKKETKIKYIFLTHFHADFVSGHLDLAEKTGATIVLGPDAEAQYDFYSAKDGEVFNIGDLELKLLHTPGHTLESSCYLLKDQHGRELSLFTGDTLFIGDVGRPDLAAKSEMTKEDLAGLLYDSLRKKILPLPDDIIIYPAHGAGSACGKNMSKKTSDTLGNQKRENYALNSHMNKADFIKEVTQGLAVPPIYFPKNVAMNKGINTSLEAIFEHGLRPLSLADFESLRAQEDVLVLDTRTPRAFAKAHIPKSIFIGLGGQFAPWVGELIENIDQKIILIAEPGTEKEAVTRLARVGYDHTQGFLDGGFDTWQTAGKSTQSVPQIEAAELMAKIKKGEEVNLLDVRKVNEYIKGHLKQAANSTLSNVHKNLDSLAKNQQYYVHCAGGYRSMIYNSIAQARGFDVVDVLGGYGAIKMLA